MASRVGQYCIWVSDLERSVRFYEDIIGLKVQSRTEIPGVKEAVLAADDGGEGAAGAGPLMKAARPPRFKTLKAFFATSPPTVSNTASQSFSTFVKSSLL